MPARELKKRQYSSKFKFCPRCHRKFSRLDTHLLRSATCRAVPAHPPSSEHQHLEDPLPLQPPLTSSLGSSPASLPSTPAQQSSHTCPVKSNTELHPEPKPALKLPRSEEEWAAVNSFFAESVVPDVLSQQSADSKHTALIESIYGYFASAHGIKSQCKSHKRQQRMVHKVKEAREPKRNAYSALKQAKRDGVPQEQIQSIAQKFHQFIWSRNKLIKKNFITRYIKRLRGC